jgi:hypothetical protein
MKQLFLPLTAGVCALFATVSIVRTRPVREAAQPPLAPPKTSFQQTVAGVGLVESSSENILVGSHLSGVVAEMLVKPGDSVAPGAPLFRLDSRHLQAELNLRRTQFAAAEARAATARTGLADAKDQLQRADKLRGATVISDDELNRRRFAVEAAANRLAEAEAEVAINQATIGTVETELERATVTAPMEGTVLKVDLRPGEHVAAGGNARMILGRTSPLYLRVDIDEHEGWKVRPEAEAMAHVRGNPNLKSELKFVRFEPYISPKRSLTGDATERVDTRVLQAIYRLKASDLRVFVGQQMDVFIDGAAAVAVSN